MKGNLPTVVLRGKYIALSCIKKEENYEINDLSFYFKKLEKEKIKQNKQKEVNEIETKQYRKLIKMENWFFEKINKTDKLLDRLIRKKDTNYQYQEWEQWSTTHPTDIERIASEYYEQPYIFLPSKNHSMNRVLLW